MTCPHWTTTCQLLAARGILRVAGPGKPNHPCDHCKAEWIDGQPPNADTLTPTLLAILSPLQASESAEPMRPPCYHLGRVISRPCNCPMRWSHRCELLGRPVARGADCRTCESWEAE